MVLFPSQANAILSDVSHSFGNIDSWTADKLDRVQKYLQAYLTALKNQPFTREYIDVFSGSGTITRKPMEIVGESLFDLDESIVLKNFIDGSARIALQTTPPFDKYTFIEKHKKRCHQLNELKTEFASLGNAITVVCEDANHAVRRLCSDDWITSGRRAVMFLDPYGTQVHWDTIAAIARTQAIDLWILFPIGTVNRLLNRNAQIQPARKQRLDRLFGTDEWFDLIYLTESSGALFGPSDEKRYRKVSDPFGIITDYFLNRLRTVFANVAPNPLIMRNRTNTPIFLLAFAAGNPKGAPIAARIAEHILGKVS